jgi:hypothetical protein
MKEHMKDHPCMESLVPVFEGLSPISINAIALVLAEYGKRDPNHRLSGNEARILAEKCVEAMEEACAEVMYEAIYEAMETHYDSHLQSR